MTGAEFRAIRRALGYSARQAAKAVGGVDPRTVRRWEAASMVPATAAAAMAAHAKLVAARRQSPVPPLRRGRPAG